MTNIPAIDDKHRVELYKMEYEQCVGSYHDIYQEIWKIFSYLAGIGAGFLVFGRENLGWGLAIGGSMLPLVYWYLGVYLPLDRYGNMRSIRLAEIEEKLNKDFSVDLKHFIMMRSRHEWPRNHKEYGYGWRVRTAVKRLGVCVITLCVCGFLYAGYDAWLTRRVKEPPKTHAVVEVKTPLQIELKAVPGAPSKPHER